MLKHLTLRDYQEYASRATDCEENEIDRLIYSVFVDKNADVNDIKAKDIAKAAIEFSEFITESKDKLHGIIKINDAELGFIPDLENITFGEVMDLDLYMESVDNHHRLMSILYRPLADSENDKYQIIKYSGTTDYSSEKMKNLPLEYYFSAVGFFERLGKDLQTTFPSYSPQQK